MGNVYLTQQSFIKENEELRIDLPYTEDTTVLGTPIRVGDKTIANTWRVRQWRAATARARGNPTN